MQIAGVTLNSKRAIWTFLLAYVAITILGTALSMGIAAVEHTPPTTEPLQNSAYLLSERFLPFLNLLVWMAGSWLYFKNFPEGHFMATESVALGTFWLVVALPLDFVAFVVVKTPLSLNPHDFYVGQFPWIYLIYGAVFVSPLCYIGVSRIMGGGRCR